MKDFDYKGYDEKTLINLCSSEGKFTGFAKWKYGVTEQYSQGKIYREYANFPSWKPLYIYSEHGVEFDVVGNHEIENDAEAMFVFSDGKLENYKKVSNKPVYRVIQPLVWYRREHKINQVKNAKGTIAFPSHSTPDTEARFDVETYIKQLKNLPDEMQPVCVCLFMTDVLNGMHKIFMDSNIPVYTAGNVWDVNFVDKYYDILKHFKYSTSNYIGTYAFYSVEMGIPFSLYGANCTFYNNTDPNIPVGIQKMSEREIFDSSVFEGINFKITKQQKDLVYSCLGLNDDNYLSRKAMHHILIKAYNKRTNFFKRIGNIYKFYSKIVMQKLVKKR